LTTRTVKKEQEMAPDEAQTTATEASTIAPAAASATTDATTGNTADAPAAAPAPPVSPAPALTLAPEDALTVAEQAHAQARSAAIAAWLADRDYAYLVEQGLVPSDDPEAVAARAGAQSTYGALRLAAIALAAAQQAVSVTRAS
jgi:hypothetical protein